MTVKNDFVNSPNDSLSFPIYFSLAGCGEDSEETTSSSNSDRKDRIYLTQSSDPKLNLLMAPSAKQGISYSLGKVAFILEQISRCLSLMMGRLEF